MDAPLFQNCRASLYAAGEPLLQRAQEASVVRSDVEFPQVMQMVMGITKVPASDPGQTEHILRTALDGLAPRVRVSHELVSTALGLSQQP